MFALHRRTAWGSAAIEASAWDFDISELVYMGQVSLPTNSGGNTMGRPVLFQFVDEGAALVYMASNTICKVPMSTPYDLLTADLTAVPYGSYARSEYSSSLIGTFTSAQFYNNGRQLLLYNSTNGGYFQRLDLDIPYYPFDKSSNDLISLTPSRAVNASSRIEFSTTGLNLFIYPVNSSQCELHQLTLAEPFDVSTLSLSSRVVSLASLPKDDTSTSGFYALSFSPDGLRFLTVGGTYNGSGNVLRMWSLRAPWDISGITMLKYVVLPTAQGLDLTRVDVDPTASYLYIYSNQSGAHRVVQYAISRS